MASTLNGARAQHVAKYGLGVTTLSLTANAEAGNAIAVDVQLVDLSGVSVSSADAFVVEVVGQETSAYTLAETGAGTALSTTAKNELAFTLSAAGAAQITCTDVSGASTATVVLAFRPLDSLAQPEYIAITFA